jgi:uncharacterized RDD family membrane protein YckC
VQLAINIAVAVVVLWVFDRVIFGNAGNPSGVALGAVMVAFFLNQFGYFIFCELTMRGQSVGKRIFGLRVIRDNGQPLEFSQSLVRGLLRTTLDMMYVGLLIILFSKKHKRLGDMAAGTLVVSERYNEAYEPALLASETPYWPNFLPDRFLLTAEERHLTEEWISRRDDMIDGGSAVGNKLIEFLNVKYKEIEQEGVTEHESISS